MSAGGSSDRFERCISGGGVALFPSDTVYGLACDPLDADAVDRLYRLKDRPPAKAAAVMFFDLQSALDAVPEVGERSRRAIQALMPGGVTFLLPNPARRFPLACAGDPTTLGLRVIDVPELRGASVAVMQSSANLAGGFDARQVSDVPEVIRAGVDLIIDGGELPGLASTVVDLRDYDDRGLWRIVRPGAVPEDVLEAALDGEA